jgi:hypothetical protein
MSNDMEQENERQEDALSVFLSGTACHSSHLSILRGQSDIIRYIWIMVCEEWWDMHIERSHSKNIPEFLEWRNRVFAEHVQRYPVVRHHSGGCPAAILEAKVPFPPLLKLPRFFQQSEFLYVNMMPINLNNLDNLPKFCAGYLPLLRLCRSRMNTGSLAFEPDILIGYLTIDERPCDPSEPNYCGLHVESNTGVCSGNNSGEYAYGGNFIPGAEHHSGDGIMTRDERIEGGIYIASTMPNTMAVWNCRILDRGAGVIGSHGNIERFRPLLGSPARVLQAGELIWMTDKTPVEYLQFPPGMAGRRKQYFKLVVGEITSWNADFSTANPLGVTPPPEVKIVRGEFDSICPAVHRKLWGCGSPEELCEARLELEFRSLMLSYGLGHCIESLRRRGVRTCRNAANLILDDIYDLMPAYGAQYYDIPQMIKLVHEVNSGL